MGTRSYVTIYINRENTTLPKTQSVKSNGTIQNYTKLLTSTHSYLLSMMTVETQNILLCGQPNQVTCQNATDEVKSHQQLTSQRLLISDDRIYTETSTVAIRLI